MEPPTLLIALDLGTTTTTARYGFVRDSFASTSKSRKLISKLEDVSDWPYTSSSYPMGNQCLPTDLVYRLRDRELLYWGFDAKNYLGNPQEGPSLDEVLVVEQIKLLLLDPDEATTTSPNHRAMRDNLVQQLGKTPFDVFEDFLTCVLGHIWSNAKSKRARLLNDAKNVELILAFPSGWPEEIHSQVAQVGYKAMRQAIRREESTKLRFAMENVYTVSETLCGAKSWLKEVISEAIESEDPNTERYNIEDLNEGDLFLTLDIGGGTGCMTLLRLVSKNPLRVDQITPTRSLQVSGAAVQAEFERWISAHITQDDCSIDAQKVVRKMCHLFEDKKKDCGEIVRSEKRVWKPHVYGLKTNLSNGVEESCISIDMSQIEACFDPSINLLKSEIEAMIEQYPAIKTIVFLGQFGGSSKYLQRRIAESDIGTEYNIQLKYGGISSKTNVVAGAFEERKNPAERFVRMSETVRSYGTLLDVDWATEGKALFPNAEAEGGIFTEVVQGNKVTKLLRVIRWEVPKGTPVENNRVSIVNNSGSFRYHTFPMDEDNLGFEENIIISDEPIPETAPVLEGQRYTLWTKQHERNELIIEGHRYNVRQVIFFWDLINSERPVPEGVSRTPYSRDQLDVEYEPAEKVKGKRRKKVRRKLEYDLHFEITEMQLQCYVEARIGRGPYSRQHLGERIHEADELRRGEFRSEDLEKDIGLTHPRDRLSNAQVPSTTRSSTAISRHATTQKGAPRQVPESPPADIQGGFHTEASPTLASPPDYFPEGSIAAYTGWDYPAESSNSRAFSYGREQSEGTIFAEPSQHPPQANVASNMQTQPPNRSQSEIDESEMLTSQIMNSLTSQSHHRVCEACGSETGCECHVYDFDMAERHTASARAEEQRHAGRGPRRVFNTSKRRASRDSVSPSGSYGAPSKNTALMTVSTNESSDTSASFFISDPNSASVPAKGRTAKRGGKHKAFEGKRRRLGENL